MKLASFRIGAQESYGAVVGDGVVDFRKHFGDAGASLVDFITSGALEKAKSLASTASTDYALDQIELLSPIPVPRNIWCIGVNYPGRDLEPSSGNLAAKKKYPNIFCRTANSFVGHGQAIERPMVSDQLDYEGEIAIIIGRRGRHIARKDAYSHILGLTLCNEGSVRDWSRHGNLNVTQGKNFDRSGSLGPWIVTTDELDPSSEMELTTRVNSDLRQQDVTSRLMYPFDFLVEYVSTFATLEVGDCIVTGTPVGSGKSFDPPKWLVPGDVVEVAVPQIGILRNTVTQEAPHSNSEVK